MMSLACSRCTYATQWPRASRLSGVVVCFTYRDCTEMSKVAYDLLTTEDSAEWACNVCITHKAIPMIKMVDKS